MLACAQKGPPHEQRINAASGLETGLNDFRLSDMGPDGNTSYNAFSPEVVFNPISNEYLVVWSGDDDTIPLVDNELEIFGQSIRGNTLSKTGTNFRFSDMGPDGNVRYGAFLPAAAFNSLANQYLVVWEGTDNTPPLVLNEFEIFGQRIAAEWLQYLPLVSRFVD